MSRFKVGDKVKIIGASTEAGKAKIGQIGEIIDIDWKDGACFVLYPKGQDWVRQEDLIPYSETKTNETMNENINLCELLKGHKGEKFYHAILGRYVKLYSIHGDVITFYERVYSLGKYGEYFKGGECMLFPSKDQRDWNKWAEEPKPKVPKTWEELIRVDKAKQYVANTHIIPNDRAPIEKAALAMMKIWQLIEVGYGGNITAEKWEDDGIIKYTVKVCDNRISTNDTFKFKDFVAFHTKEQRDEFLSYPENVQLVKDFYMI